MKLQLPFGPNDRDGFYWPDSEQKRMEVLSVKRNSPANFEDVYQGRPGQREGSIFLASDLNAFYVPPDNLALGVGTAAVAAYLRKGHAVVQAWDTAFSTSSQSAHTVCITGMLVSCDKYHRGEDPEKLGPCESHFDVLILEVMRKKLDWGDLTTAFKEQFFKWNPDTIVLEKKASGISLFDSMKNSGLPIITEMPTDSKGARATNSINTKGAGSVQGWFRQHRVLTPQRAAWLAAWTAEMKDFSGNDDASSDQVDATVHLITRAIKMGAGMAFLPTDWTPERSAIPSALADPLRNFTQYGSLVDPRMQMLGVIGILPELVDDPYYGTCARCISYKNGFCSIHKKQVIAMDGCINYDDQLQTEPDNVR